jgi:hypothetical protein
VTIKKYESGKLAAAKIKRLKKDSYITKHTALLSEVNRIASPLEVCYPAIDELMDKDLRNQKILDRALKLIHLPQAELALDLAKSQILLELITPYYKEYEKQCNIFKGKYQQEIAKQYQAMKKRSEAKNASSPYLENFQSAKKILANQKVYDFIAFRRQLNKVLGKEIPYMTARNYFVEITGLISTKKLTSLK